MAMDALRVPPGDSDVTKLSGGERRRVALCQLLLSAPDLLLLDEPTNHLDAESVSWLETHLRNYKGAVLIVTHDRYFLDNVTSWILELDRGRGIPYEGNYSAWLVQKQKRLIQENRDEESRMRQLVARAGVDRGELRRRGRPSPRRVSSAMRIWSRARMIRSSPRPRSSFPSPSSSARKSSNSRGCRRVTGDRLLIDNLTFKLPPGGIVGVIGPNGAGKTTLFRMLTGQEAPDAGKITIGDSVKLGYVDQSRDALDPVEDRLGGNLRRRRSLLSREQARDEQLVPIAAPSTSRAATSRRRSACCQAVERNRVHLAKMLKDGANLLLLDEPTNDLDVETLRALEEALEDYAGCAVVISHDRWFLDRLATHILAYEGDSHVEWFRGQLPGL